MIQTKTIFQVVGAILGALVALFAVAIGIAIDKGTLAGPVLWRFPQDYRGWVIMEFENPRCQPLARDRLYMVIPIAASGRGCTSTQFLEGWRYTQYRYIDSQGRETKLRADGWNTNSTVWPLSTSLEKKQWYLFVGTQGELSRSWGSRPDRSP